MYVTEDFDEFKKCGGGRKQANNDLISENTEEGRLYAFVSNR